MNYPKPARKGYMLDLWNQLQPDHGYSSEEISKIAEGLGLPVDTASNLINTSIKQQRGYLVLDQSTGCYFRSDSSVSISSVQNLNLEEPEVDEIAIARNIAASRKQLKDEENEIALKMQQIEKLNQEVAEHQKNVAALKEKLQPLRHFFPASAA
jgi:uncharacterized coiled-coil protein SlyX